MDSKWLVGIGVGLVAAASLVAVGAGGYELGQRDDDRVLVTGSETIDGRIIVDNDGWRHGPGGLVFPLLIAGVIFLIVGRRRHRGWCGGGLVGTATLNGTTDAAGTATDPTAPLRMERRQRPQLATRPRQKAAGKDEARPHPFRMARCMA